MQDFFRISHPALTTGQRCLIGIRTPNRALHATTRRLETPTHAFPKSKPVGAFRGGLVGFALGTALGAYGSYFYLLNDYKRSNDMLNEDMYALQMAVTRLTGFVTSLETKVDDMQARKK